MKRTIAGIITITFILTQTGAAYALRPNSAGEAGAAAAGIAAQLNASTAGAGGIIEQGLSIGSGDAELLIPNRRFAQPMVRNQWPDGHLSELGLDSYEALAELGYGVVGIEGTTVTPSSRVRYNQLMIGPGYEEDMRQLAAHIRENSPLGESQVICIQLTHSGSVSDARFSEVVRTYPQRPGDPDYGLPEGKLLTDVDVEPIIESFVNAADIAYKAGINMVDIGCCHGYLLGQFLRPANQSRDNWSWGGSFDNRVRIVEEIVKGIRQRVPDKRFKIMARTALKWTWMSRLG